MDILYFLLFGLVVGAVARMLVPGNEHGGWITSIVIGISGSVVGGYLGRTLGLYRSGQLSGFLMALVGAVVVLICYHALFGSLRSNSR
jgi:uncharacterized membrane protein YeaQ/YmgE (transglycosylase-associated protein family)